jgi:hypothetical protein
MDTFRTTPIRAALALALVAVVAAGSVDGAGKGRGHNKRFKADLDATQVIPAVSSSSWGEFRAILSDDDVLTYELSYSAIEGATAPSTAPTVAHVHIGQPGVAGGVMFFLCGGGTKPACPDGPALVTGMVVASDVTGPAAQGIEAGEFASAIKAMRDGIAYANVHSTRWPSGEIRGLIKN